MSNSEPTPLIYVASLSDYNAGRHHGAWIDACQSAEDIADEVTAMLAESREAGAEEWAIHDFEGFGSIRLGEWESFERVAELAQAISENGSGPVAAFLDFAGEWDSARFQDSYRGEFASLAAYAEELADDMDSMTVRTLRDGWQDGARDLSSEWPFTCIDWERAGRELELGGDIHTTDSGSGTVYVFDALA